MSEAVAKLTHALKDQPKNPLRNHQVEEYTHEQARLKEIIQAPAYVSGDRGAATKRYAEVTKLVDSQIAKPLQGARKDEVAALSAEVLEQTIRPALLPREEMRRNPAGAVGRFLRVENSKPVQQAIQQWKRAQLALEPENPDPDLANVERFRPELIAQGQAASFMPGAQIPGNFAMTPQAKANWPLGEPTVETPLKTAQKKERSLAQIEALSRAQAAAKAKREAAAAGV